MFNRIAFAGATLKRFWYEYIPDLNKREFFMLTVLVLFTVLLGIYPSIVLDGLHYYTYDLIYNIDFTQKDTV
jgi:NADH-ubiquinone oxidoreductase chain 4